MRGNFYYQKVGDLVLQAFRTTWIYKFVGRGNLPMPTVEMDQPTDPLDESDMISDNEGEGMENADPNPRLRLTIGEVITVQAWPLIMSLHCTCQSQFS